MITTLLLALAIGQQDCPGGVCPVPERRPMSRIETASPGRDVRTMLSVGIERNGSGGSGTIFRRLDNRTLVLTCAHIFREGTNNLVVVRADGSQYGARFLARSKRYDLAAVEIQTPPDVASYCRSMGCVPGQDWELEWAAAPPGRTRMNGYGTPDRKGRRRLVVQVGGFFGNMDRGLKAYGMSPRLGDSGGGAWDANTGEFAGVLIGRDGDSPQNSERGYIVGPAEVGEFMQTQECCFTLFRRRNPPQPITQQQVNVYQPPPAQQIAPEPIPQPVQQPPQVVQVPVMGLRGEKGEKGDPGDRGTDGINGTNGRDGVNGTNGKDGAAPTPTDMAKSSAPIVFSVLHNGVPTILPNGKQNYLIARPRLITNPDTGLQEWMTTIGIEDSVILHQTPASIPSPATPAARAAASRSIPQPPQPRQP